MKRHPLDAVSLISGLLFAALGITIASGSLDLADDGAGWLLPAGLILLGLMVLSSIQRTPRVPASEAEVIEPEAPREPEDQEPA